MRFIKILLVYLIFTPIRSMDDPGLPAGLHAPDQGNPNFVKEARVTIQNAATDEDAEAIVTYKVDYAKKTATIINVLPSRPVIDVQDPLNKALAVDMGMDANGDRVTITALTWDIRVIPYVAKVACTDGRFKTIFRLDVQSRSQACVRISHGATNMGNEMHTTGWLTAGTFVDADGPCGPGQADAYRETTTIYLQDAVYVGKK